MYYTAIGFRNQSFPKKNYAKRNVNMKMLAEKSAIAYTSFAI